MVSIQILVRLSRRAKYNLLMAFSVNNGIGSCSMGYDASNTVWFTFTVPTGGSGRYGLGFCPNNWDSQVAIWSAHLLAVIF